MVVGEAIVVIAGEAHYVGIVGLVMEVELVRCWRVKEHTRLYEKNDGKRDGYR